jgi:hypothetical protein
MEMHTFSGKKAARMTLITSLASADKLRMLIVEYARFRGILLLFFRFCIRFLKRIRIRLRYSWCLVSRIMIGGVHIGGYFYRWNEENTFTNAKVFSGSADG